LFSIAAYASEVKTDLFTITLPDTLAVETDNESRLLAFGKNNPYSPPFLSIEFNIQGKVSIIRENVNKELTSLGGKLTEVMCSPDCSAWYGELEMSKENKKLSRHHYIGKNKVFSYIISYGTDEGIDKAKLFVFELASQLNKS